ncbi:hypothetical protein EV424DRAFT_1648061 [Suillus variegatus]|nr:hypothetical protein EV424DRAFT_1648061 [Suillus variegatus]
MQEPAVPSTLWNVETAYRDSRYRYEGDDIRRSLDRDPQLVQQDEQDRDAGIEENHFAGYDASGDVPDTATNDRPLISPPQNVILQRSPSQDYTLMTAMFAPLDVGERVITEDVYTRKQPV